MAKFEWKDSQKSVLNDSGNMLVSASAGTGKTTVMLEKVLRLVEDKNNLDRFLIITFSTASASEMKEKLIKKIYEKLREKKGDKKHLKKQLDLIDFSNISTIDSFFYSIFKMFYAVIGYDPAFEVIDEKEADMLFNYSIDQIIEEYLYKKDDDFFGIVERFIKSRDIAPLKKAIKDIFFFINKQRNPEQFELRAVDILSRELEKNPAVLFYMKYHNKMLRRFRAELENLLEELRKEAPNLFSIYKDYIKEIINISIFIYKKESFIDFSDAILQSNPSRKPRSPKDLFGVQEEKNEKVAFITGCVKDYIKEIKKELSENSVDNKHLLDSIKDVKKLLEIVFRVRDRYQKNKQKRKKLDFSDLSLLALKIVNIESCRNKIRDSFDYVFVDEYQDTNYIQEEIIRLVSKNNNLFMVGDIKQSIYQFRDAQPKIFLDRYNVYENDLREGKNKNLNDNFRSDKNILDFVNMVFSEIMHADFGGVDYRNNALLVAAQNFPKVSNVAPVEIFQYAKPVENQVINGVYSVKGDSQETYRSHPQALYIANKISSLVKKQYIYDKELKQKRVVEYNDIAILMYKRDDRIVKELQERRIPFSASRFDKDEVYEIELMVDYLRLINNMTDDIALSSIMLSPLYSFVPEELLQIRKNTKKEMFWESLIEYKGNQTIEIKIKTLLDDLDRYRRMSFYTSVYELMLTILAEGFDACLLQKGEEAISKVNNFINSVKQREFIKSIAMFLDYYDNSDKETFEASSAGNSVKITTIHQSKGLEFPVVFVADCHKGFDAKNTGDKDLFSDNEFGIALKSFDTENKTKSHTILTKSFLLKNKCREKEELLRLMYVAFTRAQNHLFVSGEIEKKTDLFADEGASFMQWLCYAQDKNPFIAKYFLQNDFYVESKNQSQNKTLETEVCHERIDLSHLNFEYKHREATNMPLKYSVTSLKQYTDGVEDDYMPKISYLTDEQRIEKGVFYHKILENIDFEKNTREQIKEQLAYFVKSEIIDEKELQNADLNIIENVLNNPIIEYAVKNKYYREKPFMLYAPMNEILDTKCRDKSLVQGVIDLLILGEKNYIIDFKVTQSQSADVVKRYEKQLYIYRKAAEEIMNIKIDKAYIFLINQNKLIPL